MQNKPHTPKFEANAKACMGSDLFTITKVDSFGSTPHYGFMLEHQSKGEYESGWMPVTVFDKFASEAEYIQAKNIKWQCEAEDEMMDYLPRSWGFYLPKSMSKGMRQEFAKEILDAARPKMTQHIQLVSFELN